MSIRDRIIEAVCEGDDVCGGICVDLADAILAAIPEIAALDHAVPALYLGDQNYRLVIWSPIAPREVLVIPKPEKK